jgi:protocatechuate 3,4-dioxygenase alpha subunit
VTEYIYEVTDVPASEGVTPWQTVGPFFHFALPYDEGSAVAGASREGAIRLHGYVYDGEGNGLPDALLEIWQADESGSFVDKRGSSRRRTTTGSAASGEPRPTRTATTRSGP